MDVGVSAVRKNQFCVGVRGALALNGVVIRVCSTFHSTCLECLSNVAPRGRGLGRIRTKETLIIHVMPVFDCASVPLLCLQE
jgi:hypothetical protein